jgi:hypothetical protein
MNLSNVSIDPIRRWLLQNQVQLTRLTIVVGVLAASLLLGFFSSVYLLAIPFALAGVLALLRWPSLGLIAIVLAAQIVPFTVGTGRDTPINAAVLIVILLLGLWLLERVAKDREITVDPSPTLRALLAFVIVTLLAFGVGQIPWYTFAENASFVAQLGGLAIFLLSAGTFFLAYNYLENSRWLRALVGIFLSLAVIYLAGRIFPAVGNIVSPLFTRNADGSLFWVWVVALAGGQALFNRKLDFRLRLALGLVVFSTFYVSYEVINSWKSGWVPALVGLYALIWVGSPRLGILATLAGGLLTLANPTMFNAVLASDEQYSLVTRVEAWRILAEIIKVNPILGLGPSNYYWYTPLYSILGWNVSFNSHNNYIDIIAQTGLLGLGTLLWFMYECGRVLWRLKDRLQDGFERAFVISASGGLVGMLVSGMLGDWILPFVYNVGLRGFRASVLGWLFLGAAIALDRVYRPQKADMHPESEQGLPIQTG